MSAAAPAAVSPPRSALLRALADGWALARPYWRAPGERGAWWLLAAVVVLTLGLVGINVLFNAWNNRFYNTLQNHDLAGFWRQLGVFTVLAAAFIVAAVYRQYLQGVLTIRWRRWLTAQLLEGWLGPGTACRLGARTGQSIDNPDQRIAEDARSFVAACLDILLGLLNALVTLVSFVGILWGLSGTLPLPFAGLRLPGYMVWVALGYSLLGTCVVQRLGLPLVALNAQQQKVEADFRYTLVQVRDHAEAIALSHGEPAENLRLDACFAAIRDNWLALIRATKRLTWFSAGYGQVANVFPILAAAPRYFSGALMLGGLMQTAQAFGQVQGALSWFIDAYPRLADWRATVNRLTAFTAAIEADRASARRAGIAVIAGASPTVELSDLVVHAPAGRAVVAVPAHRFEPGTDVLVAGPSGIGKSSLLRAMAGAWHDGRGTVTLPAGATLMFVPQRAYLPDGTLRAALAYPREPSAFDAAALRACLVAAGLGRRAEQLDSPRRWSDILSPGEQQRVLFARVMLHRPDWVFLDESTSALDEAAELELYRALRRACPATTIVSIGHRSTLKAVHDAVWRIGSGPPPADGRPVRVAEARMNGTPAPAAHAVHRAETLTCDVAHACANAKARGLP